MAERAPNEGEPAGQEGEASRQESFLDQFLRRLDQTDQEAAASPSTSGTTMPPSSDYSSLTSTVNPWSFISPAPPGSPLNPDLQPAALTYRSSAPSPGYTLSSNPLAEFPWLLEEFDQQQRVLTVATGDVPDAHDSAQRSLYSSYTTQADPLGPASGGTNRSPSSQGGPVKEEPGSTHTKTRRKPASGSTTIQPGGHHHGSSSHSSKLLDTEPVPRFGEPGSTTQAQLQGTVSSTSNPVASKQTNNRPPTSPLLSDATAAGTATGSVTTSAGTSNTSLSSESTSNAGDDDDESEVKKEVHSTEGASSRKRKKPEAESGGAGDTPSESKKSDQPKNKPRKRGGAKRLREPRYAIKTRTDVDVLDDGFKWRKYGQKAVKNSPHPRNYYRCTTPLCPVRKRVERSNEDAGLVITTYEGTHTHQTPGFHRPSPGGYFGDRPLGMGGGLFQSPLGPGGSTLLPLPPGFDLASLQQATALRNIRGLQPNQNHPSLLPGSSNQALRQQLGFPQESSLFRAQQFLDLQDGTSPFGAVKQEPFQFTAQDFISRNLSLPGSSTNPSQILHRSMSDQRPGPGSSPLNILTGLSNFPRLQPPGGGSTLNIISGSASSSNIGTSSDRGSQGTRHELQPGSSSQIDESLETIVSSSSGHPNQAQGGGSSTTAGAAEASQPQPGRRSLQIRGGQPSASTMQHHQSIRSTVGQLSSSENLHGLESESSGPREGLLQDMVRHGGPKVSKS